MYSDTPLADYLEGLHFGTFRIFPPIPFASRLTLHKSSGSGEHDPTRDTHSPFIEPADPPQIFVPPTKASFRSRFSGKALKNLDAEKWGKRSPVKRVFSVYSTHCKMMYSAVLTLLAYNRYEVEQKRKFPVSRTVSIHYCCIAASE